MNVLDLFVFFMGLCLCFLAGIIFWYQKDEAATKSLWDDRRLLGFVTFAVGIIFTLVTRGGI